MMRVRLHSILKTGGFLRSAGALVSASIVGQLILLSAMPLVTRLYQPADFGLFALFTGVFGIVLVASSLRYELAIPLAGSDRAAFALLVLALLINTIVAVAVAAVVVVWGESISQVLGSPELMHVLWLLPISIWGAGSYRAFRLWAVRQNNFKGIARTKIGQSAVNAASQIGLGWAGLGAPALAISHFLGMTAGIYRLARSVDPALWTTDRRMGHRIRLLARRYSRFPKFDVAASFVDALSVQLPNLLLALLFNPVVAGQYLLADRILGASFSLLSQSVGQVLYARSRRAVEERRMFRLATMVLTGLATAMLIPSVAMFFISEPLFAFVFGEQWRDAGLFAGWLAVGLFGQFLFSSISLVLMATGGQKLNLVVHAAMLCMRSGALLYGYAAGSALGAIVALSCASFAGYTGAAAIVLWHAHNQDARAAGYSPSQERS